MGTILKKSVKKSDGSVAETNFPVTVRKEHGFTQYFYSPHGFWISACDIGREFRQFDGSVITWTVESHPENV